MYTATIALFPLAYLIPLIIDSAICFQLALFKLLLYGLWYVTVLITTGLAFNIAIVFRKWIMRPNQAVMPPQPQPQQEITRQHDESGSGQNSGKDNQDSYSDPDSDA